MRILQTALLLVISLSALPAFADKPAPPFIAVTPGRELELPRSGNFTFHLYIVRRETSDDDPKTSCSATQGSHHVEGTGDWTCDLTIDTKAGFGPGALTFSGRTNDKGVWSEPSTVDVKLVSPGNLWAQSGSSQNVIAITDTPSATLANGKLSFTLSTQNSNDNFLPMSPYLGRVTIAIPANGKIDQVVSIEDRWLEPLAKSKTWASSFHDGQALLTGKSVHITGTYSKREGAQLVLVIPGQSSGVAEVAFTPLDYKVNVNFIDCDKLSESQRRQHSVCN